MKNILLAIVLLVFPMYSVFGQSESSNDSIAYYEINKWALAKLTIAYMEDLGMNQENEKKTYEALKSKYETYSDDINLVDFENFLSEGWKTTKTKVYEKYKLELVDSVTKFNFNSISFKPQGNEKSRLIAISQINEKFDSIISIEQPDHFGDTYQVVSPETENAIVQEKTSLLKVGIYLILGISILLNIFLFLKFKSSKKNQKSRSGRRGRGSSGSNESNESNLYENKTLKITIEELKKENIALKNKIENYDQKSITALNNMVANINEENLSDNEKSPTIELEVKKEYNTKKTIYLPTPFAERKFAIEDVSETEKQISLYVAEIDLKTNKGVISLIETADLSRALNSPNLYLETVCDYENQYSTSAKGIKVINKGEVTLEGEDWVVKKKIKIKFI